MSSRFTAPFTLIATAPVLTELVSGNTPAHAFLNPSITLFLLFVYGVPLLVIRELRLRWRLSTHGIFLLGLAYGILNEGLVAQTLVRHDHVDRFDRYIYAWGFNLSWIGLIVPWHALLAVLFPMTLVSQWFPKSAQHKWLGRRAFYVITALLSAAIVFFAIVRKPQPQMLACLAAMAVLVLVASRLREQEPTPAQLSERRALLFLAGMALYPIAFLGMILLATLRVPAVIYFLLVALLLLSLVEIGPRYNFLLLSSAAVALGAYFSASIFHFLSGMVHHSSKAILIGGVLAIVFFGLAWWPPPNPGPGTAGEGV